VFVGGVGGDVGFIDFGGDGCDGDYLVVVGVEYGW